MPDSWPDLPRTLPVMAGPALVMPGVFSS